MVILLLALTTLGCSTPEEIFIRSVNKNTVSIEQVIGFLQAEDVSDSSKYQVASSYNHTLDELCIIFEQCEGKAAKGAMDRIIELDREKSYELGYKVLEGDPTLVESEKLIWSIHAVADYFAVNPGADAQERKYAISRMMHVIETASLDHVKSQTVYAMAHVCDYERFELIIDREDIDKHVKWGFISGTVDLMSEKLRHATPEDDISAILKAMRIYPIRVIGNDLKVALNHGRIKSSPELRSVIVYIEHNGRA